MQEELPEAEKFIQDKKFVGWKPKLFLGMELQDKYFGILGAGRIGTAVAKRAHAFGCKIIILFKFYEQVILKQN
ncbi:MAG: hypothetical protein MZV64_22265 [Ignavibacteriales bacterium]|nr:hypothetical protein [Ignavibacteriales bacterium]